ncbi:MAG: hypothetical protein HS102_06685 [Planctomycetia bacterium]|nr:hypothetical protein [Planctomycetia bacterium]
MSLSRNRFRMMYVIGVALAATVAVASFAARQAARAELKLPVGEWAGEGIYVYETWIKTPGKDTTAPGEGATAPGKDAPAPGEDAPTPVSTTNRYPAQVTIKPSTLDGRPVVEIQIISRHKDVGVLSDDVRIHFAVEEAKKLSDAALLYRTVAWNTNLAPDEKLTRDPALVALTASLIRDGEDLVFQIQYGPGYADTFRFRGPMLEKTGTIAATSEDDPEQGFIHWVETLRRR